MLYFCVNQCLYPDETEFLPNYVAFSQGSLVRKHDSDYFQVVSIHFVKKQRSRTKQIDLEIFRILWEDQPA